ncbi:Uncharacterized protein HZ326_26819 [Fusarium oxysporum f. sp. albedinis]|nr:Uncharacterized protein HZ326_26819 [Fusarium oxysporum f. sp. albedinis]
MRHRLSTAGSRIGSQPADTASLQQNPVSTRPVWPAYSAQETRTDRDNFRKVFQNMSPAVEEIGRFTWNVLTLLESWSWSWLISDCLNWSCLVHGSMLRGNKPSV